MLLESFDYVIKLVKFQHRYQGLVSSCVERNDENAVLLVCIEKHVRIQYKQHNLRGRFFMPHSVQTVASAARYCFL